MPQVLQIFIFWGCRKSLNVIVIELFFRENETEILKEQIDKLQSAIFKEEDKAKELEVKARYNSVHVSLQCCIHKAYDIFERMK